MPGYWGPGITQTDCAYYIREREKMITCEGSEEGTLIGTRFRSEKEKIEFQRKHCFKNCSRCKNAEYLDKKYSDGN